MIDLVNDLDTSVNYQLQNSLYIKKINNNFYILSRSCKFQFSPNFIEGIYKKF